MAFLVELGADFLGDGLDGSEPAAVAAIRKLYTARDLGKQRVVGANAHVDARLYAGAALADNDGSTGNQLAGKRLHAQPLRIRVASICGAASTFLMCHCLISL